MTWVTILATEIKKGNSVGDPEGRNARPLAAKAQGGNEEDQKRIILQSYRSI